MQPVAWAARWQLTLNSTVLGAKAVAERLMLARGLTVRQAEPARGADAPRLAGAARGG